MSQTEENVAVAFPPKKRRRKSVTVEDSSVTPADTVAPTDTDKVNVNNYVVAVSSVI